MGTSDDMRGYIEAVERREHGLPHADVDAPVLYIVVDARAVGRSIGYVVVDAAGGLAYPMRDVPVGLDTANRICNELVHVAGGTQ